MNKPPRLLLRPPQHLHKHLHPHRLKRMLHIFEEINPQLLHLLTLRPRPTRPIQPLLLHRLEPNFLHPPLVMLHVVPGPPNLRSALCYLL